MTILIAVQGKDYGMLFADTRVTFEEKSRLTKAQISYLDDQPKIYSTGFGFIACAGSADIAKYLTSKFQKFTENTNDQTIQSVLKKETKGIAWGIVKKLYPTGIITLFLKDIATYSGLYRLPLVTAFTTKNKYKPLYLPLPGMTSTQPFGLKDENMEIVNNALDTYIKSISIISDNDITKEIIQLSALLYNRASKIVDCVSEDFYYCSMVFRNNRSYSIGYCRNDSPILKIEESTFNDRNLPSETWITRSLIHQSMPRIFYLDSGDFTKNRL